MTDKKEGNNILISKLDGFIRRYYKNLLIRGSIWFVAGAVSIFLISSALEYFGHFGIGTRTVLFYAFLLFSLAVLVRFVVIPLLKLYNLGERIDYKQAARIVGDHFPEISDKLLNTLQLSEAASNSDNALLQAAISQKTESLKPVPFQQAIDLRSNLKYVKYAAAPLLILILVILVAPGFSDSSKRLVQYNKEFVPEAPFEFVLSNKDLNGIQQEDFDVELITKGKVVPSEVYIDIDGYSFKMKSDQSGQFRHTIKRLSSDLNFRFEAEGFNSKWFTLNVLQKPSVLDFTAFLDYPSYTGLKDQSMKNTVDFQIPAGTTIRWEFNARNTRFMKARFGGKERALDMQSDRFFLNLPFRDNQSVRVTGGNEVIRKGDSLQFNVQVIPDEFPAIEVEEKLDSNRTKVKYLIGDLNDDYGFSKLLFKYRFVKSVDPEKTKMGEQVQAIPVSRTVTVQNFYHYWNLDELNVQASDKIEYYFEVWDNDAVNGPKSSRSVSMTFEAPTIDQINALTEQKNEEIKSEITSSKKSLSDMDRKIKDLERKMTERKELTWEEKKEVKELLEEHKKLQDQLENIIQENKENNTRESEFKQQDEEIKNKQEELEELFNEVMDEEMKKLMDEIQKLMEQNNKEDLMQKLDQMKLSDKEISKQMDRMLEQLKQLQLEKKVNETVDKLEKLAEKQKELSEESKNDKKSKEDLLEKQEELNKEFDKIKEDLKDIDKKNKELEQPLNMDTKEQQKDHEGVQEQQQEGTKQLGKDKRDKASEQQQKASEGMKKMAKEMNQMMQSAMEQQQGEDYNKLREILENLVQVSKDQEALMEEFKTMRNYNPRYVELGQGQKKIKDDTKMIEDSLFSLSKRVKQVEHFVNKEIGKVNHHMGKTIAELGERRTNEVVMHQQYVMTSLNNLALMLGQSLEQMQQEMQSQKQGQGSCQNPGQNQKPGGAQSKGMQSMRQMQESLKKQLEEMHNGVQKGQKPGSKEFAEAAAMQAAIRKKLKDLQSQLEKEGKGKSLGNLGQTEEMMDDLEKDLYNKRMNSDVLKRQQEILTRLLEHEKAEREQEQDNKRKSNEGKDIKRDLPPSIEEYLKQKEKEQELLRSLPPDMNPYYKQKVREYFNSIND
ncbi:MAG: DUF4175 domain-containing protein [Flavobacteriales bacterium]|nr:DUF4175 domain-containing protein [Flavobacteriales bacterium]